MGVAKMLIELVRGPQRLQPPVTACPARVSSPPRLVLDDLAEEAARREKMKQLFGIEDTRGAIKQVKKKEPEVPEWRKATQPEGASGAANPEWRANWLTLWLQDSGISMDKVLLVEQADERRLALVTAQDVEAGATLFEVPDCALLTADTAFALSLIHI